MKWKKEGQGKESENVRHQTPKGKRQEINSSVSEVVRTAELRKVVLRMEGTCRQR
jgi:hypothetical protein